LECAAAIPKNLGAPPSAHGVRTVMQNLQGENRPEIQPEVILQENHSPQSLDDEQVSFR